MRATGDLRLGGAERRGPRPAGGSAGGPARGGPAHQGRSCRPAHLRTGSGRAVSSGGLQPALFHRWPCQPGPRRAAARHEETCAFEDAAACAARLLRDGGRFAVCHRPPQQLARVLAALTAARLEPKRLQFVKQAPDAALPGCFVRGPEEPPPRSDRSAGPSARPVPPLLSRGAPFSLCDQERPFGVFRRGLSFLCAFLGRWGYCAMVKRPRCFTPQPIRLTSFGAFPSMGRRLTPPAGIRYL